MSRRPHVLLGVFFSFVSLASMSLTTQAPASQPGPGPREVMASMVDPAANFIWRSVSTTVTTQGIEEKAPQNEREWTELRNAADLLAEGGRLLKKDPQREGDKDWLKWSQAIVDSAMLTLEAIESKSADQVLEAGEAIYNTCVGCHGGYWRMSSP